MFHVKHSPARWWVSNMSQGAIPSVSRALPGSRLVACEWRMSTDVLDVDVSRETSILDDLPKTVLNGRGLDRCRGSVTQEEAHGGRQHDEDFRRSQSERWGR